MTRTRRHHRQEIHLRQTRQQMTLLPETRLRVIHRQEIHLRQMILLLLFLTTGVS